MSSFVREAGTAVFLVMLTLCLQCAGMAALISFAKPSLAPDDLRLGPLRSALLMVRLMTAFIVLHIFEILLWAAFYRWLCFPLWESAFYFSTSSYATVGYGDIVLPQMWRTLGPLESIIGVLMCGLSASFLFAIVNRLVDRETKLSREPASPTELISTAKRSPPVDATTTRKQMSDAVYRTKVTVTEARRPLPPSSLRIDPCWQS
jgi:voltage-gated potassium channel